MDWSKLKAEYIAGGTSYRKLAKKYEVSANTLTGIAIREGWNELKKQAQSKSTSKMVDSVAKDIAKKSIKINDVADKLLDKIAELLDVSEFVDSQVIKQCTSALKDIKDIKGIKSDIDLREQEARIDKLRKDADINQGDEKPYGVVLMPPIMDKLTPPSEEEEENDG